jgi:hypothetical protein
MSGNISTATLPTGLGPEKSTATIGWTTMFTGRSRISVPGTFAVIYFYRPVGEISNGSLQRGWIAIHRVGT